jgi:hypothetical protein
VSAGDAGQHLLAVPPRGEARGAHPAVRLRPHLVHRPRRLPVGEMLNIDYAAVELAAKTVAENRTSASA